ncbi:hypothetical protein MKW92_044257 [Papaver armeniacum]|nr:hypothetical protein MKW92_044257 [Papaver armeniacum]
MAATLSSMSSSSTPNLNYTINNLINKPKFSSNSLNFGFLTESNWRISQKKKINSIAIKERTRNCKLGSSVMSASALSSSLEFDVVIVGAGVIGLTIARQFLNESDTLSVAVVDAFVPCSHGATGAGQGYLWMVHKTPGTEKWELAMRSKRLWEMLAESIEHQGRDPLDLLGWKKTGSLLIGRTQEDASPLKERVKLLSEAGLRAEYLSSEDLRLKEPSLEIEKEGGAAFLPDDCQLDARRTVAFLEKENRQFASRSRYAEFYNEPALRLIRSNKTGEVEAVQTSKNLLYCKKAVVVAAGSWSGSLMKTLLQESNIQVDVPVKPRKGHLLVIENFKAMQLHHGLMEVGYINHQFTSSAPEDARTLSVSMAATTDSVGNLVLVLGGKPMIGPVPGLPNLVLAAGHEGEGLSLALGTAEMVADMVLGNTGKVNFTPYSVRGREC